MQRALRILRHLAAPAIASTVALLIGGSTAQTSPTIPTVDLSVGPIAASSQAVNIALALSVEFPTLGAAYRNTTYDHSQTYIGYWDSGACYEYFDEADTSSLTGKYFRRTGSTDTSGYCNTTGAGTGYSGNLLNYVATSSIDLLRFALTGGHRILDTTDKTVLSRAYLAGDFRSIHQGSGGYWPEKQVASALVGKVTPVFANPGGSGNYAGTVYFNSCDDFLLVGNSSSGGSCDTPGNSNIFGPPVPDLSGSYTTLGFVTTPVDTASTTYVPTGVKYWGRSNPVVTTTVMPSGYDPDAGTLVPEQVTPSPRNFSVVTGTQTTPQYTGDAAAGVLYTATSGTSTSVPPAGAESPPVIRGYVGTSGTSTTAPPTAAESPAVIRGYVYNGNTTTVVPPTSKENPAVIRGYVWTGNTTTVVPPTGAEGTAVVRGYVVTGTSTAVPPTARENPAVIRGYVVSGTSTSVPPSAAESPAVIRGYVVTGTSTSIPPAAAEPTPVVRGNLWTDSGLDSVDHQGGGAPVTTVTVTRYYYVCHDNAAPRIIRVGPQAANPTCPAGTTKLQFSASSSSSRRIYVYYNSTPYYNSYSAYYRSYSPFYNVYSAYYRDYAPYYREYDPFYKVYNAFYKVYTPYNYYNVYQLVPAWYQASVYTEYRVYSNTTQAKMKAYVRVCDSTEGPLRTDLCAAYPSGNYKPVGEVQRYSTNVRLAAFGYLADDVTDRYGGVLRAPMRYVGPEYHDTNNQPQTNSQAEWDATTGVFATNPLNVSGYSYSGVINYLNRFGTTGTPGNYKGYDPVGELFYEALRYYQGLGPTSNATSSITGKEDGYPVYSSWTDPVQNACERRNYILVIGDVNTWYDKYLPGHNTSTGVNDTGGGDSARSAVAIPGSSETFNAVTWTDLLTGFETNTSPRSYTDSLGRLQTTSGNPNPNSNNTNLATKCTGAGCAAYYWAGAAYWANTQPIRKDTKGGQSMKDIRVKTFAIDVDEGGNGNIEDANPRSIKPRRSSFYLAGKYGWFNDANLDGNPFRTSGGTNDNTEWEDPTAANTPDGYVIASQAQRLIAGIRKFFKAAGTINGSASVAAISTSRFTANSPNGDFFTPLFAAGDWSGTIQRTRLVLNTTTGEIESTPNVVWDAGQILTVASSTTTGTVTAPYVKPADRKIFTLSQDGGTSSGQAFTVANKANLDSAVRTALATNPATGQSDAYTDQRINWLRGDQTNELSATGGYLRHRGSIMGDIINSGPVYKEDADPNLSGPGYLAFAQSVSSRTAVLYVGANDGMLHAFRARDGMELFAYIPRAVAPYLNRLTHPAYTHRPYVDAVPQVGEVQVGSAWKTLLVSGMGGGGQGVFALDVTTPESFGAQHVLWEFTDADDAQMGNVITQPALVKLRVPPTTAGGAYTYKWFVVVGSGYNNYAADGNSTSTGAQALFFLSVDKQPADSWQLGTNYFKVSLPIASTAIANGLSNPGFYTGPAGEATVIVAGDLQGNVWKFDLSAGISTTNLQSAVFLNGGTPQPLFVATDSSGTRQPITTQPQVVEANSSGYMVVVGTGKFVEPTDTTSAGTQTIYGIWDSLETSSSSFTVPRTSLYQRSATLSGSSVNISTTTFVFGKNTGQYRGWYLDMPATRERIAVDPALGIGIVAFVAAIPEGTCSGDGTNRKYCLNPVYGTNQGCSTAVNPGLPSSPKIIQYELEDSSYTARTPTGRRNVTIEQKVINSSTKITTAGNPLVSSSTVQSITIPAGRISWRELRQ